jgi:hypothetical protein
MWVWVASKLLPLSDYLFRFGLWALLLCSLTAAILRGSRRFCGTGIVWVSYVWGASLWMYATQLLFEFWGVIGMLLGFMGMGIGTVPLACLACLFGKSAWGLPFYFRLLPIGSLVLMVGIVGATREFGHWMITKGHTRQIAGPTPVKQAAPGDHELDKKMLTEQEVASLFVRSILEESPRVWSDTRNTLKENFAARGKIFAVSDESMAVLHLSLAAIALNLQSLGKLFSPEQASRIKDWVFVDMNDPWGAEEVRQYEAAFQRDITSGEGPFAGIAGRLLYRWLGDNFEACEAEVNGKKTGFVDVMVMTATVAALTDVFRVWNWGQIRDNFTLTERDI